MSEELKDQRVTIMLTPSEFKAVEDWSFKNRIRSRGEAIRRLISLGLYTAATKAPVVTSVDKKGVTHYPHVHQDGKFRVADPLLGADKKKEEKQIPVETIDELIKLIQKGFHVRMSDHTSDGADLTAPQNIKIEEYK